MGKQTPKEAPPSKESQAPRPPRVPEDLKELERAIMLLGSLVKVGLRAKGLEELSQLLGAQPSAQQAQPWKNALSRLRRDRVSGTPTGKPPETEPES